MLLLILFTVLILAPELLLVWLLVLFVRELFRK